MRVKNYMSTKKSAAVAALLIGALGIAAGGAHAAPTEDAAIGYTVTTAPDATVITTDAGTMTAENGVFTIRAADGATVAGAELRFRVDDYEFPITATIRDRTATLTPRLDPALAVYKPVALPYEDKAPWKSEYDREQAAWSRMTSTISMGATIGTLAGGLGGAAVGCVLGGIAGATVASATIAGLFGPFIPAAAVGCVGGIVAVGALGTVAGQLLVTAPVAVLAAAQYFTTITAPFPR